MLSIRNARIADIPLIRELTFNIWPQTYRSIITKEQIDFMLDRMYSEASLTEQMNKGNQFVIINDTDEPVGFAAYQEIEPSLFKLH